MAAPNTVGELTELGRVRLSEHFSMREMLYSEVANFHGMPNIPDDPEMAIAAASQLCERLLEPLYRSFGAVDIRSAYRSPGVNGFCNEMFLKGERAYFCSDNDYNSGRHIWDRRDAAGNLGATVSAVIPWYLPRFRETQDPRPLAWWIKDHLPDYAELIFFPWNCAFNIRWYEGVSEQAIYLSDGLESKLMTKRGMADFDADHSALYQGFPELR